MRTRRVKSPPRPRPKSMSRAYHKSICNPVTGKRYYLLSDDKQALDKATRRIKGLWAKQKKRR